MIVHFEAIAGYPDQGGPNSSDCPAVLNDMELQSFGAPCWTSEWDGDRMGGLNLRVAFLKLRHDCLSPRNGDLVRHHRNFQSVAVINC